MINKEFLTLPIDEVIPYENNPRVNDIAVNDVVASIRQCENIDPIEIDENNIILSGHTRLKALKALNYSEVQVLRITGLTDEQKRKYRILANKTAEKAEWDFEKLELELDGLDFDGFDFGFDVDLPSLEEDGQKEVVEDDYDEEPPAEPKAKLGDLYQLGRHRLMCGDSTDVNVIDRLMDGVKAQLLLTDPPYGIDVVQNRQVGGGGALHFGGKVGKRVESSTYIPIANDDTTDTARANYDVALTCTENQIIFGGNYFTDFLPPSRCWIVWDKQNTGNFADAELAWTSFDKGVKLYHFLWNGLCREGSREVEGKTRVHPTQKPVGMLADILKDFSEENDSILDCFGGSGSTLIACEQLNRKCYMCELDPRYIDVIIDRWEKFTGGKAVLGSVID